MPHQYEEYLQSLMKYDVHWTHHGPPQTTWRCTPHFTPSLPIYRYPKHLVYSNIILLKFIGVVASMSCNTSSLSPHFSIHTLKHVRHKASFIVLYRIADVSSTRTLVMCAFGLIFIMLDFILTTDLTDPGPWSYRSYSSMST